MYRIEFNRQADKFLDKLPRETQARIIKALEKLADNPRPVTARKIEGADKAYRIKVGDYRIIYDIEDEKLVILILRIGHRKDVYRFMPSNW